jgi:predicted glycoside hydrolase/deacetylase ChbG (UPF0249 family)
VARRRALDDQIHRELEAQLADARHRGIAVTHVDSREHVYMNPYVFAITSAGGLAECRLLTDAGVRPEVAAPGLRLMSFASLA